MTTNKGYVDQNYLNKAAEMFQPIKTSSYQQLSPKPNEKYLDLGCGPGIDTIGLYQFNGGESEIFGIDFDQEMVNQADANVAKNNLEGCIKHMHASAYSLPFENDFFEGIRCERVFMHLEDPQQALNEMLRCCKPGGTLAFIETDWGSMSANFGDDDIERRLSQYFSSTFLHNGFAARKLPGMLAQAGLKDIKTSITTLQTQEAGVWLLLSQYRSMLESAFTDKIISHEEKQRCLDLISDSDAKQSFFCSIAVLSIHVNV